MTQIFANRGANTDLVSLHPTAAGTIDNMVLGGTVPAPATITKLNSDHLGGHRNFILNGDMRVDRRQLGTAVTLTNVNTQNTIDTWSFYLSQASKITAQQVTSTTKGSAYALTHTVAATATVGSADYFVIRYPCEGSVVGHLQWGTANALSVTLSGIINSSLTGNLVIALRNATATESYVTTLNIPTANVDQSFSITIPGPTSGTFSGTVGFEVSFSMGTGSTSQTSTLNAWQAANVFGTSGQINYMTTLGATLTLKDMQLEAGTVATPYERLPMALQMQMCSRYFQRYTGTASGAIQLLGYNVTGAVYCCLFTIPTMRASPSVGFIGTWATSNCNGPGNNGSWPNGVLIDTIVTSTGQCQAYNPANGGMLLDASL